MGSTRRRRRPEDTRHSRRVRRREAARSFYRGTALSTILPGAGLFRVSPVLASLIVTVFVGALAMVAFLVVRRGALRFLLDIGVDRDKLLLTMVGIVLLAAVWVTGIITTANGRRPRQIATRDGRLMTAFTALMCLLVIAPTAVVLQGLGLQRQTLGTVVTASERPPMAAPTDVAAEGADASDDPWAARPRVNLLLLGSDAAPNRVGVRPDSIMVASIDTRSGDTVFIGLPRNLERAPFPEGNPLSEVWPFGFDCGHECMLNAVWTSAEDRPDLFPGDPSPGLTATRDVVSEITGLTIHDSVIVDLRGFEELVDAMGGVTINATERVSIGGRVVGGQIVGIRGWIEPGVQHMDGYHALWYARSRATTDDFSRMRRQRCVVGAIVDQVDPLRMLARYPQIARVISDNLRVDIPAEDLAAWAELVLRMKDGRLQSLPITNRVVHIENPDFVEIRRLVRDALRPQPASTATPTATPTAPSTTATSTASPGSEEPGPILTQTPTPEPTDELADLAATC